MLSQDFKITGATGVDLAEYGPFKATLTDSTTGDTGEKFVSDAFTITVDKRTGFLPGNTTPELDFTINRADTQHAFFPIQEALAATLHPFKFTLIPTTLPDGLYFDEKQRAIYGTATGKNGEETISNYQITATETDGSDDSLKSGAFTVKVQNPKPIGELILRGITGNVDNSYLDNQHPPIIKSTSLFPL